MANEDHVALLESGVPAIGPQESIGEIIRNWNVKIAKKIQALLNHAKKI